MCRIDTAPLPQEVTRIGPKIIRQRSAPNSLIGSPRLDLNTSFSAGSSWTPMCKASAREGSIGELILPVTIEELEGGVFCRTLPQTDN
jgi:hypothetical protein